MSENFRGMRLRAPCDNCPFRNDEEPFISRKRRHDIAESMVDRGESFTCHKHNDFDEHGQAINDGTKNYSCAGGMIWLAHQKKPNKLMQIFARMGWGNPADLKMDSPVYTTRKQFEDGK